MNRDSVPRMFFTTAFIGTYLVAATAVAQAPRPPKPQPPPDTIGRSDSPTTDTRAMNLERLPNPSGGPEFGLPTGLKSDPDKLFDRLGMGKSSCFPLTPVTCFEAGLKCYRNGLFHDALAFTDEGLKQCNHARLYLLKAVCEMHLNRCDSAAASIKLYRTALLVNGETVGLGPAREQINDPMRVRLESFLNARP